MSSDATPAGYWELTVPVTDETSEALTNFLWELGAVGVLEETVETSAPRLRAFFSEDAEPDALARRLGDYQDSLAALGFGPRSEASITALRDGGWAEAWRAHFQPVPVGRRLLVVPPWITPPADGRLVVTIEPGRAFGTGHHGSTAGCLEAIEDLLERATPARAIDLGTGSGILAVAMARLGVPAILAIDEDPDAIACAVANAALNGACAPIRCVLADAGTVETAPVPLVVANLLTAAHFRLGPRYRRLVALGGSLVLGGILATEAHAVSDALLVDGFVTRDRLTVDGWATLVLTRDDAT